LSDEIETGEPTMLAQALEALEVATRLRTLAAEDRRVGEDARGHAQHALRTIRDIEAGISARERKLAELQEPVLLERERIADAKLAEAQELMNAYDKSLHQAALALAAIDKRDREAAEARKAAKDARGKAA
jgi:hypothetical protein